MSEQNRKIIFFDVDGTLYPIRERSFLESPLNKEIERRTVEHLVKTLNIQTDEAKDIFEYIKRKYPRLYSVGLNRKYGISREDYIRFVWGLNPREVVPPQKGLGNLLAEISQNNDLFILSDAPRIWINNVLNYFDIQNWFNYIFSGVEIGLKKRFGLFKYALSYVEAEPSQCFMVGDEVENDVLPSKREGMKTVYVGKERCNAADYSISNIFNLESLLNKIKHNKNAK